MIKMRLLGTCLALGGAALVGGCATYPAGSYGYADPYYVDPGPVYVQPNVYIDGGYYSRPRYPYYGRPGYYGPRHGYAHPGRGPGPRPGAGVVPRPRPGARDGGGVAGNIVPIPPGRSAREINQMLTSPDSRNQTPP
ncbi:hypothetical protein [Variovorax sp. MHTC-1]|uniref:hypothetical protein n=1 Tax=Variovorax sp. MHTC-1 TaxID=2495593 RepID=UPI000F87AC05|nr:hypothetical protein [Variovorax sp. MHTC-1]RST56400.1 hypothetical protein EJI01_00790 [Variovorax sp. MHTC-1]